MKILRFLVGFFAVMAVLFTGSAFSGTGDSCESKDGNITHKVQNGESLYTLTEKILGSAIFWKEVANVNQVNNSRKLKVGTCLHFPERLNGKFAYNKPNSNPYFFNKDPKKNFTKAMDLLGIKDSSLVDLLYKKVKNKNFSRSSIQCGEVLTAMTFGRGTHARSEKDVINYCYLRGNKDGLVTRAYSAQYQGKTVSVEQAEICNNWFLRSEKKVRPAAEEDGDETEVVVRTEVAIVPEAKVIFGKDWDTPKKNQCEDELSLSAGVYQNRLLKFGRWGFGEYLCWKRFSKDPNYQWAIGMFGSYGKGYLERSDYQFEEYSFGLQTGLQHFWKDDHKRLNSWQIKFRYGLERQIASNPESGYNARQYTQKIGLVYDRSMVYDKDWRLGYIADMWYGFDENQKSTWSGDKAGDRSFLGLDFYAQRKVSENWQIRGINGLFFQDWDDLFGTKLQLQFRYKEVFVFGPYISLPFTHGTYENMSRGDLTTYGFAVRFEGGTWLREKRQRDRMNAVSEWNGGGNTHTQGISSVASVDTHALQYKEWVNSPEWDKAFDE